MNCVYCPNRIDKARCRQIAAMYRATGYLDLACRRCQARVDRAVRRFLKLKFGGGDAK
jgi:hypothetical protein